MISLMNRLDITMEMLSEFYGADAVILNAIFCLTTKSIRNPDLPVKQLSFSTFEHKLK